MEREKRRDVDYFPVKIREMPPESSYTITTTFFSAVHTCTFILGKVIF